MAEVVGLASFAFQSSITLYETFKSFHSHPKRVRDLTEELEALIGVLGPLKDMDASPAGTSLPALDLPLKRCGNACKEFEQHIMKCLSRSGGDRKNFRGWACLRYMGDDIDGFRRLIAGYKLTINIALANATLHHSTITAEILENQKQLIEVTKEDLEAHLESIDKKLERALEQATTGTVHDTSEMQEMKEQCLSTERYLQIFRGSFMDIEEVRLNPERSGSLKRLFFAYREDWDVQSLPMTSMTETISHMNLLKNKIATALKSPLQRDFTIAIFCAMPLEVDAVNVLFDELYQDSTTLYQNAPGDSNTYTLGRMGHHNTVLVHLPGIGKSAASQAASSIRSTYPNIKLALVVGICGGIPSKKGPAEILLGDVVVSEGIVQHDLGKRVPGGFVGKTSITDGPGRPSSAIRGFLSKLKTMMAQKRIQKNMENYLRNIKQTTGNDAARYPGVEQDKLFQSTYRHEYHDLIDRINCVHPTNNAGKLVQRKRLQDALALGFEPSPTIHLGLIASEDTVMKSGQDRDLLAGEYNVIAIEMEGVGVWDSLPCLVVKGVCDYADSHKNKIWQPYAAATGAACMRALLDEWTF